VARTCWGRPGYANAALLQGLREVPVTGSRSRPPRQDPSSQARIYSVESPKSTPLGKKRQWDRARGERAKASGLSVGVGRKDPDGMQVACCGRKVVQMIDPTHY
jgi:hypothetical protein